GEPVKPDLANASVLDWAIRHEFERNAVVSERQLVTTALKHGLGRVTLEGIYEEVYRRPDLIRRIVNGTELVTTRAVLNEEKSIIQFAEWGKGRWQPMGRAKAAVPATLVPGEDKPPSPSQAAMMRHIWESRDSLLMVRGLAGVGKTETLKATLDQ